MERWRGRVALVTGASAGIGYCVTKALVQRGMKVVACARNIVAIQVCSHTNTDTQTDRQTYRQTHTHTRTHTRTHTLSLSL